MILLARHGETQWNRAGRVQGHLDSPLTARGEAQARGVGVAMRALSGGGNGLRIATSPLGRARATAEIIGAALDLPAGAIATDDRLKEISCGDWDGLTLDEIEARDPGELERRKGDRWDHLPPGGESYAASALRAAAWLADIDACAPLIVVSHGGIGRVLRGTYAGLAPREMLSLDQPQDAFHLLRDGQVGRVDAHIADAEA